MTRLEKVLYTARTHTTGGREGGASRSSDGRLDVKLTVPGTKGDGTNPEQLFAAGWSSCFFSALKLLAFESKIRLSPESAVDAEVDLGTTDGQYFLQARLTVSLPGLDREAAQSLVDRAHLTCPYSKAVQGNIDVQTTLVETDLASSVA